MFILIKTKVLDFQDIFSLHRIFFFNSHHYSNLEQYWACSSKWNTPFIKQSAFAYLFTCNHWRSSFVISMLGSLAASALVSDINSSGTIRSSTYNSTIGNNDCKIWMIWKINIFFFNEVGQFYHVNELILA